MKRNEWEFYFTSTKVVEAATRQIDYHSQRVAHWEAELNAAEEALRGSVDFREHDVTGGKNISVVVDPEKQSWLNTCRTKLSGHRAKVAEYSRWRALLGTGSFTLALDSADYEYFFATPEE